MFSSNIRFTAVRVSCTDSLGGPVKASSSSWLSMPMWGKCEKKKQKKVRKEMGRKRKEVKKLKGKEKIGTTKGEEDTSNG